MLQKSSQPRKTTVHNLVPPPWNLLLNPQFPPPVSFWCSLPSPPPYSAPPNDRHVDEGVGKERETISLSLLHTHTHRKTSPNKIHSTRKRQMRRVSKKKKNEIGFLYYHRIYPVYIFASPFPSPFPSPFNPHSPSPFPLPLLLNSKKR